jgi:endonuclease/exonuclease/phosphatase family metal-dependent hydrolase
VRFATVLIGGSPLECVDPGGRGVFGNAVMTKEAIKQSADRAFTAQAGGEERRWICVETARQVKVCTTHLSTRGSATARAANDGQCAELAAILAEGAEARPTIASGGFNREDSCAPARSTTPGASPRDGSSAVARGSRVHRSNRIVCSGGGAPRW